MREEMKNQRILFVGFILFLSLTSFAHAEDYGLQYFLSKASSKTIELSKEEMTELFDQLSGVMQQAQRIRTDLIQAIQTGETDIRYQEGEFWMSKLEKDQESIETGIGQIKLLKEKPIHLVASIRLYKSLKDLSSNFNAYNNMTPFSAIVGDFAPEMELWADPIFYKLCLLPLAHLKDVETKPPPKGKKPQPKVKKP
jgi:hypothetical protein